MFSHWFQLENILDKELAQPTYNFNNYKNISYSPLTDTYTIDPDGSGPAAPFTFITQISIKIPERKCRSEMGIPSRSLLYFVWTQTRSDVESVGEFDIMKDFQTLLDIHPDNIFAVKFTYWLNM